MEHREGEFKGEREVRIWFQVWRPQAPRAVVVVVHGLGEHSGRYRRLVDCLVPRRYAVYALDLRGHGRSEGRRGHVERFDDYISDAAGLVEQAAAKEPGLPLFLFGYSLGGLIVLRYALERPQGLQGFIASAPGLRRRFEVPGAKLLLARFVSRGWPTFSQRTGLPAHSLSHDPQVGIDYLADPLVHGVVTARFFTEASRAQEDVLARAREVTLPCLFLQGGDDRHVDARTTCEFFQGVASADKTLQVYEGLYHELHNELDRERPLADVVAWLEAQLVGVWRERRR